ncbi:MAG TPA: hypothetical protein VJI33_02235 [Candidatus Paceibacterota bacterium]
MSGQGYLEHSEKAVEPDSRFKHVMAISLDPTSNYQEGVIRCITSRSGEIGIKGNLDRSVLHFVRKNQSGKFEIQERLQIENEEEIVGELLKDGGDFIGLEDADIWIDEKTGLKHLYFTIPIIFPDAHEKNEIHLGHAVGKDLKSLEMIAPALLSVNNERAKEVSIAPVNKKGFRHNLVESSNRINGVGYSTVKTAIAEDMGKPWKFGDVVFHPAEHKIPWIGGHASPGPLFPKDFIDVGEGRLLGIINGREANTKVGSEIRYGIFSVGLFIYNFEQGKIDWVTPTPFIIDSEAKNITFASQFVPMGREKGILYAHVDDSFVRAYDLNVNDLLIAIKE